VLTKSQLREMRELVARVQQGSVSRDDWSNLAALTLIYQGDTTVAAIAAGGFDEFLRTSKPIYHNHGFKHSDYRRIYKRVCEAAERYHRDLVPQ
jgi:hypothetical protein